jgi:TolB protein
MEPALVTASEALPLLYLAKVPSERSAEWNLQPDIKGRQIAFESDMGGDREIYVLGKRGVVNVTNHPAADWTPRWSPDGKYLAFESFRNGRRGVYLSLVETARITPVAVSESWDCWSPDWSPDGKWIAFVSNREGKPSIHVCQPEDGDSELVPTASWALAPAWRPKGK